MTKEILDTENPIKTESPTVNELLEPPASENLRVEIETPVTSPIIAVPESTTSLTAVVPVVDNSGPLDSVSNWEEERKKYQLEIEKLRAEMSPPSTTPPPSKPKPKKKKINTKIQKTVKRSGKIEEEAHSQRKILLEKMLLEDPLLLQRRTWLEEARRIPEEPMFSRRMVPDDLYSRRMIQEDPLPRRMLQEDPLPRRMLQEDPLPRRMLQEDPLPRRMLQEDLPPRRPWLEEPSPRTRWTPGHYSETGTYPQVSNSFYDEDMIQDPSYRHPRRRTTFLK